MFQHSTCTTYIHAHEADSFFAERFAVVQGKMSSRASVMADIYSDCTEVKQEEGGYTYAYVKAMETAKPLPTANIHFQDADAMLTDMVTELAQGGDVTEILGKYQEKIQNLYNS